MSRCLYNSNFEKFINADNNSVFGELCDRYHGEALTTTREAWKSEIFIMKHIISKLTTKNGEIIFEYDIPRLGKRIDVVLLIEGIIFCLEFKVGETRILENDIDQVLDYALDLKNFHKFSEDKIIVPILIATNYSKSSTDIQMSNYDDGIVNPFVTGKTEVAFLINKVLQKYPKEEAINTNWIISPYVPIVLTRDMEKAKDWLHSKVRGTERTGVLITKESSRYKPLGIHVLPSGDENAVHWFLDDKANTKSSNYLEDAATEIQVQGLELDYTCLLWDADMRFDNGEWKFYKFNGITKWNEQLPTTKSKQELHKYMLNAYRVLLTRARAGMVICVPKGNPNKTLSGFWEDSTRLPEYYNGMYEYLKSLGIEEI